MSKPSLPASIWPSLDHDDLLDGVDRLASEYAAATPFPHIVLDNFLPVGVLDAALAEFPPIDAMDIKFASEHEIKSASRSWRKMGQVTRSVFSGLNSGPFVGFLEQLTGIEGLVPDPHLEGGGQHQTRRDGKLDIHADFNWYRRLRLDRRLNLLLYLNRGWEDEWGGHLELWNNDMSRCEKRIAPTFGRCVIFSTTDESFHGLPDPLRCPPSITRKSLALYYYSNGRPEEEQSAPHNTMFKPRPGTREAVRYRPTLRRVAHLVTPPIVVTGAHAARRALSRVSLEGRAEEHPEGAPGREA